MGYDEDYANPFSFDDYTLDIDTDDADNDEYESELALDEEEEEADAEHLEELRKVLTDVYAGKLPLAGARALLIVGHRLSEDNADALLDSLFEDGEEDEYVDECYACSCCDGNDPSCPYCHGEMATVKGAIIEKAEWSTARVNNLPDSAFFYVENRGAKDEEGKTVPRTLRHLPYRNERGDVDLPHLRNALARLAMTNIPESAKDDIRAKAEKLLADAKNKSLGKSLYKGAAVGVPSEYNSPRRIREGEPGFGVKKFVVYAQNDDGDVRVVRFGDANMEIRRDNPARRASFNARHKCDTADDVLTARYWSCRQWRANAKVEASAANAGDALEKAGTRKYLSRIATGNPKRPWRYIYSMPKRKAFAHESHFSEGARIRGRHNGKEGHWHVDKATKGHVTLRHTETGHSVKMTRKAAAAMLEGYRDTHARSQRAKAVHAARAERASQAAQTAASTKTTTSKSNESNSALTAALSDGPSSSDTDEAKTFWKDFKNEMKFTHDNDPSKAAEAVLGLITSSTGAVSPDVYNAAKKSPWLAKVIAASKKAQTKVKKGANTGDLFEWAERVTKGQSIVVKVRQN